MHTLPDIKLPVIGLGYVGLPLAVQFAKQRDVLGFNINRARIDALRAGHDATLEVSDQELREAKGLRYSPNPQDIAACNVFIVTVPTPIDEHRRPDLTPPVKASEIIGKALKKGDIVICESTVHPGATEEDCVPVLARFSGLKFNTDSCAGYSPERFNPGDVFDAWVDVAEVQHEYGLTPIDAPEPGAYDAIIVGGVAHQQFKDMGADAIRTLGKAEHVVYDLKYVMPRSTADLRL